MKEASFDELRQAGLPEKVAKTFKTRYKTNNYYKSGHENHSHAQKL